MTLPHGFSLSPERPDDGAAIERVLDAAFGTDRRAKRSYAYRRHVDSVPSLRLTARDADDRLVGTIRYWPIAIRRGEATAPALLLGPLAVEPSLKGIGLGRALVRESLEMARAQGHALVLLVGDLPYYAPFGFVAAAPLGFVMPHEQPHRLQALELVSGAFARGGELVALDSARSSPRLRRAPRLATA